MALIICSECGKEISDSAKKCPHCGFTKKSSFKISKKLMIFFAVIVMGIVIVFASLNFAKHFLTAEEKAVVECVQDLKDSMKSPGDFLLEGNVVNYFIESKNNGETLFTTIDYSGTNSYGARSRGQAIYKDGEYIGDMTDYDPLNGESMDEDELEIQKALWYYKAQLNLYFNYRTDSDYTQEEKDEFYKRRHFAEYDSKKIESNLK